MLGFNTDERKAPMKTPMENVEGGGCYNKYAKSIDADPVCVLSHWVIENSEDTMVRFRLGPLHQAWEHKP